MNNPEQPELSGLKKYRREIGTAIVVVLVVVAVMAVYFSADRVTIQGVVYGKDENGFYIKAYVKGIDLGQTKENYYVYIVLKVISVQGEATEQTIIWRW